MRDSTWRATSGGVVEVMAGVADGRCLYYRSV